MSRSPRFFSSTENPFPLFLIFSFPSNAIDFVAFAHDLFSKNSLAVALMDELRQNSTRLSVSFVEDSTLFSFGFFSGNCIFIRDSLTLFEKSMVLLFELCNVCNKKIVHCVFHPEEFSDTKTYAEACESAEFLSLQRAAQIYKLGFEQNLWPDFSHESAQMRDFGLLLHMNCDEYLKWSQTARPEFNGASHASHYEDHFRNSRKCSEIGSPDAILTPKDCVSVPDQSHSLRRGVC